ncbi:WG repeat-containing protein [candidate division KSB1 bacterium]|nr:WG repeat-containing protein [candidate division KSB1 bacterium]
MITSLNFLVSFTDWLFEASLKASILIALILIIQLLLRRKMPARWQHGIWFLVIVRLISPFDIESQFSLFNLMPAKNIQSLKMDNLQAGFSLEHSSSTNFDIPPMSAQFTPVTTPDQPNFNLSIRELLSMIWLSGSVILLLFTFISNFKLWRRIRSHSFTTNPFLLQMLEQCKKQMNITGPIKLVEMDGIRIPVLFGIAKSKILVPINFSELMTANQMKHIFLHELAHYKRNDVLISCVTTLLQIIHWFNPIIWFAFYRMRIDRELACDEMTLSRIGVAQSQSYGKTIISLLEGMTAEFRLPVAVGIIETKKHLKRRLSMIANFKKKPLIWSIVAAIILITVGAFALTDARISSTQTDLMDSQQVDSATDEFNISDSQESPQEVKPAIDIIPNQDEPSQINPQNISKNSIQNDNATKPYRSEVIIIFTSEGITVDGEIIDVDSLAKNLNKFSFDDHSIITLKHEQNAVMDGWFKVQTQLHAVPLKKIKYVNAKTGREVITNSYPYELFHYLNQFLLRPRSFEGKYGYVNRQGEIVIDAKFDMAWPFEDNLAGVQVAGKWGFIDSTGNFVIEPQFDAITSFKNGVAVTKTNDKWEYIDPLGKPYIKARFTFAHNFNEGYAPVQNNQKWAFVSKVDRDIALNYKYDRAYGFSEGLAAVRLNEKWGFVDYQGTVVIAYQFDEVDRFCDGLALARLNKKYGYIDKKGNFAINPQFEHAESFSEGLAAVQINEKYGFIDKNGEIVIEPQYDHASNFMGGLAHVIIFEKPELNSKGQGFEIDKAGNVIGKIQ